MHGILYTESCCICMSLVCCTCCTVYCHVGIGFACIWDETIAWHHAGPSFSGNKIAGAALVPGYWGTGMSASTLRGTTRGVT